MGVKFLLRVEEYVDELWYGLQYDLGVFFGQEEKGEWLRAITTYPDKDRLVEVIQAASQNLINYCQNDVEGNIGYESIIRYLAKQFLKW